ncbi:MAG: hypothetical protein JWN51_2229 [Phycisphaerales bacterium]|nr:hypothetical protein [Phycisphaerales bacterium]
MFLNAIMLIGLGGAVVPLVLHLLSRARYKDVDWGAMMFLQGADARQQHSARLSQILLLLVRAATVALLAVALARPIVQGRLANQETGGRVTAALLLDCSASMAFDENGRTRFQMAQAAARQVLRGLRPGDRVTLILMGAESSDGDLEPTGDLRAVEARIDEAKVGFGRVNLRDSLSLAAEVLGRYEKSARDVYVVCDRQALSWREVDERFRADWLKKMRGPGLNSRMFVLPVGNDEADNVAVESIRLLNAPAIVDQPADFEVSVHNYGLVQRAAVPLSIQGGKEAVPDRTVNLAPNQSVTVPVTVTFGQAGSQILTAQVKATGFAGDDRLASVVQVIDPIRVLAISGDEQPGQFRGASDYIKWALAPHRSANAAGADPCTVTVLPAEKWTGTELDRYQVVVLANVERFTPPQVRAIERYVYAGGRLLVAPGSLSRAEDYNTSLYRDGAGVLPAILQPPTPGDGSESTSILGMQTDHPIFQFFRGRFDLPSAIIARYMPAVPRQVDADVLAWYLTGDPLLIEGRSERGRVLLLTTSLDADWTTLPLSNFYLPFVQSAVRYLAGGTVRSGNLAPGEPIRLNFDDAVATRTVTLTRPDGRTQKLEVVRLGQQAEARFADTDVPGEYRVQVEERDKPTTTQFFVVRPPREESDLSQLTDEQWSVLKTGLGFQRIDTATGPIGEAVSAGREGHELWGAALGAVFVLVLVEMLVARGAEGRQGGAKRGARSQEPGARRREGG